MLGRLAVLLLATATIALGWTESVEFPWNALPRALWERKLVWLKNLGVEHVSLPRTAESGPDLTELIRIVRALRLEADLEGPIPDALRPFSRAHGGPLTDPLPTTVPRVSVLAPDALLRARRSVAAGAAGVVWTEVQDTLGESGYRAGAVSFLDEERPAFRNVRRAIRSSGYWGPALADMRQLPGAAPISATPAIAAQRYSGAGGASFVAVSNLSTKTWTGDVGIGGAPRNRISVSGVTIPPHDSLWLPVQVPLMAGPLCRNCTAFATVDRLVSATAELTAMEYENGILAMEFTAPASGEAILQLSREPTGPYVAGGKPTQADWDERTQRIRLPIPAGKGPDKRVRIGLAIEPPDATAFFSSAHVLLLGETTRLVAEFSSEGIAQRSRLRAPDGFEVTQQPGRTPLEIIYSVKTPAGAVHGDRVDLSIEADGERMSHIRAELLRPATVRFPDAIAIRVAASASAPILPATAPVNARTGRDITISVTNHAPEIRTFRIALEAAGLEFSPESREVSIGASTARDVSFRVFARGASPGPHAGEVHVSGAASASEAVRFLVVPANSAIGWSADGFVFLESARMRASFLSGRWLEFLDKDSGQSAVPAGGIAFAGGPMQPHDDTLVTPGQRAYRMTDLELAIPKAR